MQRTFHYDPDRYKIKIVFTGYFMIFLAVLFGILWLRDPGLNIYVFAVAAAVYGSLNTFVFKSNPGTVTVDDESITFNAFGEHKYMIEELAEFNVREFANASFYIRIRTKAGKFQRYWIHYYYFNDNEILIDELYHIEMKIRPETLKFRGRKARFTYRPGMEPEGWNLNASDHEIGAV